VASEDAGEPVRVWFGQIWLQTWQVDVRLDYFGSIFLSDVKSQMSKKSKAISFSLKAVDCQNCPTELKTTPKQKKLFKKFKNSYFMNF
jgi:hypothetical protein